MSAAAWCAGGAPRFCDGDRNGARPQGKTQSAADAAGDVPATFASADLLERLTGYRPRTEIAAGVAKFVEWYREYYKT